MRDKKQHASRLSLFWMVLAMMVFAGGVQAQELPIGSAESFVDIHGYADLTYYDFETTGDPNLPFTDGGGIPTFDNNHFTLYFGAGLSNRLRFQSEIHWEHSFKEPELPQANIMWRLLDPIALGFGRFWLPFGTLGKEKIYNPTNPLVSFPYTVSQVLPFHSADSGVQLNGKISILSYEFFMHNGFAGLDEDAGKVEKILATDNNQNKRFTTRVQVAPIRGASLAGSYSNGKWDDENESDIIFWGLDGELQVSIFSLTTEYIRGRVENPANAVATVDESTRCNPANPNPACDVFPAVRDNFGGITPGNFSRQAYFVQLAFRVLDNQMSINSVDVVARWDAFDRDNRDRLFDRYRSTFGLNITPEEHFHLKVEYQSTKEKEGFDIDNNGYMGMAVVDF